MTRTWLFLTSLSVLAAGAYHGTHAERGAAARLGVVRRWRNGCSVLQVAGLEPLPDTPVAVVRFLPGQPQSVVLARVLRSRACFDGSGGPVQGRVVALELDGAALEPGEAAIGVVDPPQPVDIVDGKAVAELGGDDVPVRFRICTSQEGVHLTVWKGEPLKGPRRWHAYASVGYDTEPTCEEGDWQE